MLTIFSNGKTQVEIHQLRETPDVTIPVGSLPEFCSPLRTRGAVTPSHISVVLRNLSQATVTVSLQSISFSTLLLPPSLSVTNKYSILFS